MKQRTITALATLAASLFVTQQAVAHNEVLAPNGGETLQAGQVVTIDWTVTIEHQLMGWDVLYSTTGSTGPWIPIAMGLPGGDPTVGSAHSLDWIVPNEMSSTANVLVRMQGFGASWEDTSDSDFTIEPSLGVRGCAGQASNSTGEVSTLHLLGSDVVAQNDLTLAVTNLPAGVFGLALNSDTIGSLPMAGGSQGTLCLGGTIGRHVTQVAASDPNGYVSISIDLTDVPRGVAAVAAMAGETYSFQWWHRDTNPQVTSNYSDVATVTLQ